MRFCLLDRITELVPGVQITAVKRLRPDEDYLDDHFPRFPVMPGVLMLEAMFQASAWLVRQSEGFAHSVVILKEARNVKYFDFITPGQELVVTAEILKQDESTTTLSPVTRSASVPPTIEVIRTGCSPRMGTRNRELAGSALPEGW